VNTSSIYSLCIPLLLDDEELDPVALKMSGLFDSKSD